MRFEKYERLIKKDIENCITRCMYAAYAACKSTPPQEPDFVAQLVQGIPHDVYNSLSAYAPGYQFAVSGIFCHQKPLADFGAAKNPELGDILLIYIEENKYSAKKCNALLMQAKKCSGAKYIVPASEAHQLQLYEEWPTFTLLRAGIYNGMTIDVCPKTLHTGAQYLLLRAPYRDEKKVGCAYPDKELVLEKKLSDQIVDLMKFFTGRTFHLGNGGNGDDWSKLIMYLINISGGSTFNRRNSGVINSDRQITVGDQSLFRNFFENLEMIPESDTDEFVPCLMIYAKENRDDYKQQELM